MLEQQEEECDYGGATTPLLTDNHFFQIPRQRSKMPKRPPTPPSTDDSQFFTIVNPYPDQPFEALEHSITFARWVACMVGEENLLAFYHKPKVRLSCASP